MPDRNTRVTHAERVLRYLKDRDRPVSAYDILDGLRDQGVKAATTVYRALDKLQDAGRIHKIESLNAWKVCCGGHKGRPAVFEICDDCGVVREHIDAELTHSIAALSQRTGFVLAHSVLEIHGRCSSCDAGVQNH